MYIPVVHLAPKPLNIFLVYAKHKYQKLAMLTYASILAEFKLVRYSPKKKKHLSVRNVSIAIPVFKVFSLNALEC